MMKVWTPEQAMRLFPTPAIGVRHPLYGLGAAPFPERLRPTGAPFARTLARKASKGYTRPRATYDDEAAAMSDFFKKASKFAPLMSEADLLNLSTSCYMGKRSRAHSQTDEGRDVGNNFMIKWREDLLLEVQKDWATWYSTVSETEKSKISMVLPTGTSLGWPFLFPDDNRGIRTLVLAMLSLAVEVEKRNGSSLEDMILKLSMEYGRRVIVPGWRYQHTSKVMPVFTSSARLWTQNVQYRTRLIAMVDKTPIIANRLVSKRAITTALKMPQHDQSRPYIQATLDRWKKMPATQCVAVDVSGFDNGFGGANLLRLLKVLSTVFGDDKTYQDMVTEVSAPMLVPFGTGMYETNEKVTPQLPSGASFTTAVGLLASDYIARLILLHARCKRGDLATDANWLSWGDDIVVRFPASTDVKAVFEKVSAELGLSFDFEGTLKYLGFDYASGTIETHGGYSTGRLLQKAVFPESPTLYPYSIIGYVARLSFVKQDARRFHELYTELFWDVAKYGPPFVYDNRESVLQSALIAASASERPDRDSLNFLLHGLDPIEGASLLDFDFDFTSWVGKSYIDISDPGKIVSEGDPELKQFALPYIPKIERYGMSALISFVNLLGAGNGWRREGVWL